jgi:L-asparaginase
VARAFHPNGAVPIESFYVERRADFEYREALEDFTAGPVHLHGSRQSGKSSLLIRAHAALVKTAPTAYVDLASLSVTAFEDEDRFDQRLSAAVARSLDLDGQEWHTVAGLEGLTAALSDMCLRAGGTAILIFDEFDSLQGELKRRLCQSLRALRQADARPDMPTVNVSLCGVEPPLGYFNGASPVEGLEPVGGRQMWLEDFPLDDATVERWCEGFEPHLDVPKEAVRAMLQHAGGYPQACSWLGNLIVASGGTKELPFDSDFEQRLIELTRRFFDPAGPTTAWAGRQQLNLDTQWVRVNEGFFVDHGATARAALDIYERVLNAFEGGDPVLYLDGDRRHELLRMSGLARLGTDSRLRLRCPLFAVAFDRSWVDRIRAQLRTRIGHSGYKTATVDKRLLIIGTGGTIGMTEEKEGQVAPPVKTDWFNTVKELVRHVEFEHHFGYDSADVGPEQWTQIVRAIVRRQSEFDGVIVAHGTDTMAYTASAVAFALGRDLSFPVVFTGSQTTVDVPHGDAMANILRSALVATQDLPEVVISFGEKVFRATRTQKKDDRRFDAFESPGYPELGFVAEEVQIFRQNLLAKPDREPVPLSNVSDEFASGILHISQLPGSEAAFYERALSDRDSGRVLCQGIIIQSLGAGNIPTKSPAFDLTGLIRQASAQQIPVVLTSQYPVLPANYLRYSPSQAAIKAGAIPTGNMTISAVLTKLSWVLPQVDKEIRQGLLQPPERINRVRQMIRREYVGEGGLTVVEDDAEDES